MGGTEGNGADSPAFTRCRTRVTKFSSWPWLGSPYALSFLGASSYCAASAAGWVGRSCCPSRMRLVLSVLLLHRACASPAPPAPPEVRVATRVSEENTHASGSRGGDSRAEGAIEARVEQDSGVDGEAVASLIPWVEASTCSFPPVQPAEGAVAKQCCTPARDLTVCLETISTIHHHAMGFYTDRTLNVARRASGALLLSLPLDRHHHGSIKYRDTASVLLTFRVQQTGLELLQRYDGGCKAPCVATHSCTGEGDRVASVCGSAGVYAWDGQRIVRAPLVQLSE